MMVTETTRRERKARVPHVCAECQTPIEKGTKYIGSSFVIDGRYEPCRRHPDCLASAELLDPECDIHGEFGRYWLYAMIKYNPYIKDKLPELLADYPVVLERLNGDA